MIPLGEQQARRAANRIIPVTPQCRILPMSSETSHLHSIAGAKVATRSARERLHTASESLHGQNDRAARISREASRADTDAFAGGADTSEPTRKSWSHPPRGNRGTMARELTGCERADRVAMSMYPSISPVMNACRYCRPNATSMGGCHVGCGGSVTERPQGCPTLGSQADSVAPPCAHCSACGRTDSGGTIGK